MQVPFNLLDFVSDHLQLIGWPALVAVAWKASRFVTRLQIRAESLNTDIQTIKDNHLAHLEKGMADLNGKIDHQTESIVGELRGMRSDMVTALAKKD